MLPPRATSLLIGWASKRMREWGTLGWPNGLDLYEMDGPAPAPVSAHYDGALGQDIAGRRMVTALFWPPPVQMCSFGALSAQGGGRN